MKAMQNQSEKTKACMIRSADTGYVIVTRNKETAQSLAAWALDLSLKMPFPITFGELRAGKVKAEGFIIDDTDILLQELCMHTVLTW